MKYEEANVVYELLMRNCGKIVKNPYTEKSSFIDSVGLIARDRDEGILGSAIDSLTIKNEKYLEDVFDFAESYNVTVFDGIDNITYFNDSNLGHYDFSMR